MPVDLGGSQRKQSESREVVKIAIGTKRIHGPWGGGNQFAHNLESYLVSKGICVVRDLDHKDIDLAILTDPRKESISSSFNDNDIELYKKKYPHLKVIHRINECDERKNSFGVNEQIINANKRVADVTIFVSAWLGKLYEGHGLTSSQQFVILNGADRKIFYPKFSSNLIHFGKFNLVTHHWGTGEQKGFKFYQKIGEWLNKKEFSRKFKFTYIGNIPPDFNTDNIIYIKPLSGKDLADQIRKADIYVTGSSNEPGSNHQNEGALCGLPLVYLNSASLPEYCNGYGIKFEDDFDSFYSSLLLMSNEYHKWKRAVKMFPYDIKNMCEKYLEIIYFTLKY